ncbi:NIF3-like protein 1 [Lytechinus variegatus]|uniref:NIF3-like protein 1 n=1 Tax=Lytechinus variegatus TaxID=7654 RepID=UPI001BB1EECE|nr:NIF3-like protein 1 [Lytechinus variegatus]
MNINVSSRTTNAICQLFHPHVARRWSSAHALSLCNPRLGSLTLALFHQPNVRSIIDKRNVLGQTKQATRELGHCPHYIFTSSRHNLGSFAKAKGFATRSSSTTVKNKMNLKQVVSLLEDFAPTSLAGSWDNVGLLVEPTSPHSVSTVCLTNDLTEEVLDEAIEKQTDLILSYHPPIFVPLKRLTQKNVKEKIVVKAIEKRIAIYSPHTSCDAIEGGVNDWLVEGLGDTRSNRPLEPCLKKGDDYSISVIASQFDAGVKIQQIAETHNVICKATMNSDYQITCSCMKSDLSSVISLMKSIDNIDQSSLNITQLAKAPMTKTGIGRKATLQTPTPVSTMLNRIKTHLTLDHIQVALGQGKTLESEVSTVGICAGSGASVLKGVRADMFLTGEMSHHDILAATAEGTSVVICNHSNTERGYLHVLQGKLTSLFENTIKVFVSEKDRDPLQVV